MEKRPLSYRDLQDDKFLNTLADAYRLQEAIISATELAIISTNKDGTITSFNKAAENLLGYSAEEVVGKETPVLFHDQAEILKHAQQLEQDIGIQVKSLFEVFTHTSAGDHASHRREWTYIHKSGKRFPVLLSITALKDEKDKVFGFAGIATDISELKAAEQKLKESEAHLKAILTSMDGSTFEIDESGRYVNIWSNHDELGGIPIRRMQNKTFAELFGGEFAKPFNELRKRVMLSGEPQEIEIQLPTPGDDRWYSIKYSRIQNEHGQLTHRISAMVSDITKRKRVEQELHKIADENNNIFNNAVNLNVIAGFDGYFKRLNPMWTELTGWSTEELKAKPFLDFVHPDDKQSTIEASTYLAKGNNLNTFENRYLCKDGTYKWLLWSSATDPKNHLIYAAAVDISERKKSEDDLLLSKKGLETLAIKLQEQNRQLDEFAHIISHNLRSPVGNITALINLLNDKSTIEDYRVIFDKLTNVSNNIRETMNDLMDTLRAKKDTSIDRVEINFRETLDKVIQSLEGELIRSGASITFHFDQAPTIKYSRFYMESIFQNLLSNAIKYRSSERKPVIHFETQMKANSIELRATDNGLGIDLTKYGDKLFGLHKTFHGNKEARGVGLFLIKTQVEALGGSVRAESEVGKGSTFTILFS